MVEQIPLSARVGCDSVAVGLALDQPRRIPPPTIFANDSVSGGLLQVS
jgi:hypothetical protein